MTEKIEAIVLGVIRHSDRHNVVTVFSRERGRMALLSPAGNGKGARLRNARLLPLAVIEADVRIVPTKELVTLGRFSTPFAWRNIYFNPVKQALTLFIQEFLEKMMRSAAPDSSLYDYVKSCVAAIDRCPASGCANMHIAFLIGLLAHMGVFPNLEGWQKGDWFDMRGGEFTAERPLHRDCLTPAEASAVPALSRMTMRNAARFRFSADERRHILSMLLRYYSIHYPGLGNLKCPEILAEVFRN